MWYDDDAPGRARRRNLAKIGGGLAAVAIVLGSAYLLGAESGDAPPGPPAAAPPPPRAEPSRSPEQPPRADALAPTGDPVETAELWLQGYRSAAYTDPAATSWYDRTLPLLTEPLKTEENQPGQGTPGAAWDEFVADRCSSEVRDLGGVIPPEAPRTEAIINVQVAGVVHTECARRDAITPPDEPIAATLELRRTPDNTWQVSRRLY